MKRTLPGTLALLVTAPVWLAGCYNGSNDEESPFGPPPAGEGGDSAADDDDGEPAAEEPTCVETGDFFREQVWAPFMSTQCLACHNPSGLAKHTDFVLRASDVPGYFEANLAALDYVGRLEIDGMPLLLAKATNTVPHGGNAQIQEGDSRYEALAELIDMLGAPVHCADDADYAAFFEGVEQMDLPQTLRRAVFSLTGRYPTAEEAGLVAAGGEQSFDALLRVVMDEPAFGTRLMEIYNEMLLTDAYLPGTLGLQLIDEGDYPGVNWFSNLTGTALSTARNRSNDAIAREPLELIRYIVDNHRPFYEIITADYTVANGYLARVYGLPLDGFTDPDDPAEWHKVQIEGIPHAGVLTTPAYLNRYPSTPTNVNRMRALVTLQYFFATDVMRLGARPLDPDAGAGHNPTMNDPACTSCHEILDPVAGAFGNWDDTGRYRPGPWHDGMLAPGLGQVEVPMESDESRLSWMAIEMAGDSRFSQAVVRTLYKGLTGVDPVDEPTDPSAPDYAARIRAFQVQDYLFKEVAQQFTFSGYDVREAIIALTKSPYFRAINVGEIDQTRGFELADIGASVLLSPLQLHRKIANVTGYAWTDENGSLLPLGRPYHLMYGGMDSNVVTEPLEELNGVMVNVAERMANEVACTTTALEFSLPPEERKLLPYVELDSTPGLDESEIRDNLVYLHERLLGEYLGTDDPQIDQTYELFADLVADGVSGIAAGDYEATLIAPCSVINDATTGEPLEVPIVDDPDYTVRAWMGVIAAMLGDHGFLYE